MLKKRVIPKEQEPSSRIKNFDEVCFNYSDEEAIKETFGSKIDVTDYLLIIAAANNDGIRTETEKMDGKVRGKQRKAAITDEIDKFSHGFFGNSTNV